MSANFLRARSWMVASTEMPPVADRRLIPTLTYVCFFFFCFFPDGEVGEAPGAAVVVAPVAASTGFALAADDISLLEYM